MTELSSSDSSAQTPTQARDIIDALKAAGAAPRRSLELQCGRALVHWQNHQGEAQYERPRHHAMSIYTRGGERTSRQVKGQAVSHGFPGAICLFPAGSQSQWRIQEDFEFVHLYFTDLDLQRCRAKVWDREPNSVQLNERYQFEDQLIAQSGRLLDISGWDTAEDSMAADHLTHWLMVQMVSRHSAVNMPAPDVSGKLSRQQVRLLQAHIDAALPENLTLERMADWVNMSPFHFARLFRASIGCAPYQYVLEQRLIRARDLLRQSGQKITVIALLCGFGDHSHFSRAFRKRFGVTPSQYRDG
ncbi:helix-turn-helix transcriptional regulator [Allohahella marinimesophila]|uniref:AraC family transcriptional regulator n=1 Tax=Allohahella marinimesophila TaxID=1054972 RepID=A0ABP7NYS2_9GAMM